VTVGALALVVALSGVTEQRTPIMTSALIASGVVDTLSTRAAVTSGYGREVNPFMRWASRSTPRLFVVKTVANGIIAGSLVQVGKTKPKTAVVIASVIVLMQLTVAARNYQITQGPR